MQQVQVKVKQVVSSRSVPTSARCEQDYSIAPIQQRQCDIINPFERSTATADAAATTNVIRKANSHLVVHRDGTAASAAKLIHGERKIPEGFKSPNTLRLARAATTEHSRLRTVLQLHRLLCRCCSVRHRKMNTCAYDCYVRFSYKPSLRAVQTTAGENLIIFRQYFLISQLPSSFYHLWKWNSKLII